MAGRRLLHSPGKGGGAFPHARSAGGAATLVRLARSMVARFSALSGEAGARQSSGAKLDGLFQTICGAVTQWAVTVPLPQQPQLQRWLLETLLADAQPAATGVVLATWSAVLRRGCHNAHVRYLDVFIIVSSNLGVVPQKWTASTGWDFNYNPNWLILNMYSSI